MNSDIHLPSKSDNDLKQKWLFACLYFSEGAPIGYLWLTLPTKMRSQEVPIEEITWLTAVLVLPWTFKFLWAPLVDLLRCRWWTLKHWIVSAQIVMGLTLCPLFWLNPVTHFRWMALTLLCHAFAAATQDVAIDAFCISRTQPGQRGVYNAWMQVGMFLGRATMGGGALAVAATIGHTAIVAMLIFATTFSAIMLLVITGSDKNLSPERTSSGFLYALRLAITDRNTWLGMAFGGVGGAAFKSLEVFYGPYLIDRGISESTIGVFSIFGMSGLMVVGSLIGGRLADKRGARLVSGFSLVFLSVCILALGMMDYVRWLPVVAYAFPLLATTAIGIGVFTAAAYSLFMDLSQERLGATQFSAFMGSTNGCESWSSYASGLIIVSFGYPWAMVAMASVSLLAIPLLLWMKISNSSDRQVATDHLPTKTME